MPDTFVVMELISLAEAAKNPAWRPIPQMAQDVPAQAGEIFRQFSDRWTSITPVLGVDAYMGIISFGELDGTTGTLLVDGPTFRPANDMELHAAIEKFNVEYRRLLKSMAEFFKDSPDEPENPTPDTSAALGGGE